MHIGLLMMHPLNNSDICASDFRPVFFGQQRNRFLLPQNSNAPPMRLTTPHSETNTPIGAQTGASAFAI